jgi:hypothetical protein
MMEILRQAQDDRFFVDASHRFFARGWRKWDLKMQFGFHIGVAGAQ